MSVTSQMLAARRFLFGARRGREDAHGYGLAKAYGNGINGFAATIFRTLGCTAQGCDPHNG